MYATPDSQLIGVAMKVDMKVNMKILMDVLMGALMKNVMKYQQKIAQICGQAILGGLLFLPAAQLSANAIVEQALSSLSGLTTVAQMSRNYDRYKVHLGPMRYIDDVSEGEQEGYKPEDSAALNGKISRAIFDHQREQGTIEIINSARKSLARKNYDIVYACERELCGEVDGYRLFLTAEIEGSIDEQFYLIARKGSLAGNVRYLVMYINRVGGIPRSFVDYITTGEEPERLLSMVESSSEKELTIGSKSDIPAIGFDFASSALSDQAIIGLEGMVTLLKADLESQLYVIGHTDATGEYGNNMRLSKARARAVKNYLVQNGIDAKRLIASGVGPLFPLNGSNVLDRDRMNRRVEFGVQK